MLGSRVVWVVSALALTALACSLAGSPAPSEPAPTVEVESTVPVPPDAGGTDACLQGTWTMDTAAADEMLGRLTGLSTLHVAAGLLRMTFTGDRFEYGSDGLTVRSDMPPSGYIEAEGTFAAAGSYAAGEGVLTFNTESTTTEIGTWRAVINGETVEMPGGGPEFSLTPPGSAPYRCSADRLEVDTSSPVTPEITMVFTRSG